MNPAGGPEARPGDRAGRSPAGTAWTATAGEVPLAARARGKFVRWKATANALRAAALPRRYVPYVGWSGYRNMGDEAILEALARAFPGITLSPVPTRTGRLASSWTRAVPLAALGGGTLVGIPAFRRPLEELLARRGASPPFLFAIGVGVEDPEFYGDGAERVRQEVARWIPLLEEFDVFSVRGPRSQAALRAGGMEARVTGDPALLLRASHPAPYEERLLGLNVGIARAMWGNDPDRLLSAIAEFGRRMQAAGWRLLLVSIWPRDLAYIEEAARRIGSGVEVVKGHRSLEVLLRALRRCHVFVGQKLHSVVLASALYVPSVMLEYQPKCLDFQLSLGRERFNVPVDRVDPASLVELVDELAEDRDLHAGSLVDAVATRVSALEQEVGRVSAAVEALRRS